MSSRIDPERTGQRPGAHRAAPRRSAAGRERTPGQQPRGSGRLDLDLQPPVALVAGTWDDDGRSVTRALLRAGFRVVGPVPGTGADTPQLVVLPAGAAAEATAAVHRLADRYTGRSVECGVVGSPVGPGAGPDPDSSAGVRVVLLDSGTPAQREAAAGGLAAVVGVLVTRVLAADPAGRSSEPASRGTR
ncbi:hypothetical protein KUM42_02460 [Modestobacter sp. L9-4]|uniref:hypothetical protein n=1 Tax=Modestobacter sp. L9-4 TaxID=2851567 RepID=UPI001C748580|nr:hypothetical protein [Modestobacter sp. L9-4]QXG76439.1 hypothetical protein KUM42_02460 [Modestobacter sp. L9-4]